MSSSTPRMATRTAMAAAPRTGAGPRRIRGERPLSYRNATSTIS
jgi:hypothetical protein